MPPKPKKTASIKYPTRRARRSKTYEWDAEKVKALREFLGLTQARFAEELGILQQTVSQWECGYHYPKGASVKVLNIVAEKARFDYGEEPPTEKTAKTGS
ncbi:MAG: helix-turn-helix domain-containing protein [Chloroflexi bacterium]|nr:helix-turn-helix domain-containing protein [Chloroflexota bacterium]